MSVISFLWRPTSNNQKYAFIPLLESENGDDDEEDQFIASNYSDTKLRITKTPLSQQQDEDETIKWVEENIANVSTSMLLDSDDEENTKFEISKMQ